MRDERAIDRNEAKFFNAALREQEPVERIAGHRFGRNGREDVVLVMFLELVANDEGRCHVEHTRSDAVRDAERREQQFG